VTANGTALAATTAVEGQPFAGAVTTCPPPYAGADPSLAAVVIAWGDGLTTTGTLASNDSGFDVDGNHTYAEEGFDAVTATVTWPGHATIHVSGGVLVSDAPLTATGSSVQV